MRAVRLTLESVFETVVTICFPLASVVTTWVAVLIEVVPAPTLYQ